MKIEKKSKQPVKKVQTSKGIEKSSATTTFSLKFIEQYPFLIFFGLLLLICTFIFRDFLFFNKLYLFKDIGSDTINSFYPTYVLRSDMTDLAFNYTFRSGMGSPTLAGDVPISAHIVRFLFNPFVTILYSLDKDNIAYFLGWMEFLKIVISGIIFHYYLRTLSLNKFTTILGALFFTFSGFMIGGSGWYQHTYQMLCFALLLFGFEQALMKNRYLVFFLVLIFIFKALNVFYIYLFGTFLIIYAIIRIIEQKESLKEASVFIGISLGMVFAAFFLNYPSINSSIESILNQPRVSGNLSKSEQMQSISVFATGDFLHNVTAALRLFSNDILGTGKISELMVDGKRYLIPDFKGYNNYYEAPMFYIGLLPLLLFSQIIFYGTKKQKILYVSFIIIWLIPIIFPYFRRAYFLFFGDYYRVFSIFFPFAILFLALKGFDKVFNGGKLNIYLLLSSLVILLIVLHYPYFSNDVLSELNLKENPINNTIKSFVTFFLIAFTLLLIFSKYKSQFKPQIFIAIAILAVFELIYLSNITVNHRNHLTSEEYKSKSGYNDYSVDAVKYLKENDKTFYRVEKDYASGPAIHGSLNDAMVQGYFGTSSYSSEQEPNYVRFLQQTEVIPTGDELAARWSVGVRNRPILAAFSSIKYMFSKSEKPIFLQFGYSLFHKIGDVYIYKNNYSLPLGFTYDRYIKESVFDSLSILQKDISLLNAMVVADSLANNFSNLKPYNLKDTVPGYSVARLKSETDSLKADSFNITEFDEEHFKGNISLKKSKLLFFSILSDKGWKLKINGKNYQKYLVNCGFTGVLLDKGYYEVELSYEKLQYGLAFRIFNLVTILIVIFLLILIIRNRIKAKSILILKKDDY